jgi:SEC-C motif-containing protein
VSKGIILTQKYSNLSSGGSMSLCPCGSENEYEQCCGKYHNGTAPQTAEELMRARYSAFAKNQIKFIADTHIPGTKDFNEQEAQEWAVNSTWKGLEVVKTHQGGKEHGTGVVEFKASYQDNQGNDFVHHEIADFKKEDGKWFYVDGQIVGAQPLTRSTPKVGRNDPCICGSGKKYKKCCGR